MDLSNAQERSNLWKLRIAKNPKAKELKAIIQNWQGLHEHSIDYILETLEFLGGHREFTAKALKIGRRTLNNKLAEAKVMGKKVTPAVYGQFDFGEYLERIGMGDGFS